MGDLRDQLKKIKGALGLEMGEERKENSSDKKLLQKPSDTSLNKEKAHALTQTKSQPVAEPRKIPPKQHTQQPSKKKSHTQAKKSQAGQSSSRTPIIKSDSPTAVTITRTYLSPPRPVSTPASRPAVAPVVAPVSVRPAQLVLPSLQTLTRVSEFKQPEAWVARGRLSQLKSDALGRRSDIFIGLDFGTAFTKAAVQIADNIYPIDWDGIASLKEKYLLPTEYSELASKECFLGQHPKSSPEGLHANLKRAFVMQRISDVSLAKASLFIALVLQYIRAWVYHHHSVKLGAGSIGWYLNIGIPSDVLDKDRLALHYKKLADVAWELSLLPQSEITFENAFKYFGQPIKHQSDLRVVSPVPELVAQLAGYSKSSRRQNGLHTLVDIGGGTVDMVTFNVHQADGDDVFPFFVSNVKPLGSYALLENRFLHLSDRITTMASDVQTVLSADSFVKFFGTSLHTVNDVDKQFFRSFQREFESVLGVTHRRRYPSSPNWKSGIRTFISGGGAFVPGYVDSIRNSHRPSNCPLLIMDLPPHPKLAKSDLDRAKYSRISVACGLAVDELSLGSIRPASEVEDGTPLISTVNGLPARERPDRDELYPK